MSRVAPCAIRPLLPERDGAEYHDCHRGDPGENCIDALLRLAGLERRVCNYPPNNLNKEWDFAEFSALDQALDDMVGPRGGRALTLRGRPGRLQR